MIYDNLRINRKIGDLWNTKEYAGGSITGKIKGKDSPIMQMM